MNEHYLYLIIDIATISFPLLFSFEGKLSLYKKWKHLLPAILVTALPFIIWDHFFTSQAIWGFNERYITGLKILQLPIEEILFFFTIPYACMFIYEYLNKTFLDSETNFFQRHQNKLSLGMIIICLTLAVTFINEVYTSVICIILASILGIKTFRSKTDYMGKYWRFSTVMLIPFFVVNSILTGTGIHESVFWYNEDSITNIRLGTIPIEDLFYSLTLMLINISLYEWFKNNSRKLSKENQFKNLKQNNSEISI